MMPKKSAALLEGTYKVPPGPRPKLTRYSISVTGATYDRLRGVLGSANLAAFVDEAIASALDDPAILSRIMDR